MHRLTVGLATYKDFDGVYFTLQSLRAHHGAGFDVLVLDNAPERCGRTEQVTRAVGGRYLHRPDLTGTSKSRDAVFRLAVTPWVLVCDSHVLFEPGAIAKLVELTEKPEHAHDLLTGPLVWDDGVGASTHWRPTTPPGLWGVWDRDGRVSGEEPFEIPMQGLGCFAMAREAWPGFHPLSRGFGGEEGYIHEKARRGGGRVLCVPQLRWRHRFRDVGGWAANPIPYPALLGDHTFNLLLQHRELGIGAEEAIFKDFGSRLQPHEWQAVLERARQAQPVGEPAHDPPRQRLVGVWYTDNTAPARLLTASLAGIDEARRQCWRHDVSVVACGWEKPEWVPAGIAFVRFSGERRRSHATIVAQIIEALGVVSLGDAVCFLEHDVLYPAGYFQRVGDAFAGNPGPVVSNLDYIGLSAEGWQPVKERHEPMHQLSMRTGFALANLKRAARDADTGSALLEPQGDRSDWVRIPATSGLGLIPAVHVNHTAGRFTSHGDVCYAAASTTNHPHWGEAKNLFPHEVRPMSKNGCGVCGNNAQQPTKEWGSLEEWYAAAKSTTSDFHEHLDTLKDLASACEHVTQVGIWGKPSRVALAQGTQGRFTDYAPAKRPEWKGLQQFLGQRFEGKEWAPDFEIEPTDLLFLDTYHTAEETHSLLTRHAPKVARYIVVHTTEIYGEKGDDGGPGVLHGVRKFVHEHREWTVIRQDRNNYGLVVLSCRAEDRKQPPGLMRKALNFSKALADHARAGMKLVDDETYEKRLELCLLCPERAHDVCSKCGCPVDKKCSWAEQSCPADPPKWGAE